MSSCAGFFLVAKKHNKLIRNTESLKGSVQRVGSGRSILLHCLNFTEKNFMLGVYDLNKPYFPFALSAKCFFQYPLYMNDKTVLYRSCTILLWFVCRICIWPKKLFRAIHDIVCPRLYIFVTTFLFCINKDFTLRKPCALLQNFYTLFKGTDGDEREEGGVRKSASSKILRLESFMLCYQIVMLYWKALTEMREWEGGKS